MNSPVIANVVNLRRIFRENRLSAEFFDPEHSFTPVDPSQWATVGSILTRCQYGLSISMNVEGIGFPILRMNELFNGLVKNAEKFADIDEKEFERYRIKADDVLFNRTNAMSMVGRTGMSFEDTGSVFASYLIRLRTDKQRVLPEYLTAYLNCPFGVQQVRRRAMPSINQANVSGSEIRRVPIPLIPMQKQQVIARLLQVARLEVQAAESHHVAAIHILDSLHPEVRGVAGNLSSVSNSLLSISSRWDAEFFSPEALSFEEAILALPEVQPLLRYAHTIRPNIEPKRLLDGTFNYIELADIDRRTASVIDIEPRAANELPSRARRRVSTGDILASSVVGSINKVGLIDSEHDGCVASTGFLHLRPTDCSSEFVMALMKSRWVRDQLLRYGTGGILSAVPESALTRMRVPKFGLEVQQQVTTEVEKSLMALKSGRESFRAAIHLTQEEVTSRVENAA